MITGRALQSEVGVKDGLNRCRHPVAGELCAGHPGELAQYLRGMLALPASPASPTDLASQPGLASQPANRTTEKLPYVYLPTYAPPYLLAY